MDTDSFSVYIKIDNIYKNIVEVVEIRFDTWKDLHQKDRKIGHWLNKEQIRWKNYEKTCQIRSKNLSRCLFLAPLWGQNIIWIFSNLRMSTI